MSSPSCYSFDQVGQWSCVYIANIPYLHMSLGIWLPHSFKTARTLDLEIIAPFKEHVMNEPMYSFHVIVIVA